MSYLRYFGLVVFRGVQHILCSVFILFVFVLCLVYRGSNTYCVVFVFCLSLSCVLFIGVSNRYCVVFVFCLSLSCVL